MKTLIKTGLVLTIISMMAIGTVLALEDFTTYYETDSQTYITVTNSTYVTFAGYPRGLRGGSNERLTINSTNLIQNFNATYDLNIYDYTTDSVTERGTFSMFTNSISEEDTLDINTNGYDYAELMMYYQSALTYRFQVRYVHDSTEYTGNLTALLDQGTWYHIEFVREHPSLTAIVYQMDGTYVSASYLNMTTDPTFGGGNTMFYAFNNRGEPNNTPLTFYMSELTLTTSAPVNTWSINNYSKWQITEFFYLATLFAMIPSPMLSVRAFKEKDYKKTYFWLMIFLVGVAVLFGWAEYYSAL